MLVQPVLILNLGFIRFLYSIFSYFLRFSRFLLVCTCCYLYGYLWFIFSYGRFLRCFRGFYFFYRSFLHLGLFNHLGCLFSCLFVFWCLFSEFLFLGLH